MLKKKEESVVHTTFHEDRHLSTFVELELAFEARIVNLRIFDNGIWIEEQSMDTNLQKGTKRAQRRKKESLMIAKSIWAVPPDADVIHGDVQDRVDREWASSGSARFHCHPMLQDTLVHMLGLLEGMSQVGTLYVTSDASQTCVEGQILDPMVSPNSQTPKTQPTVVIAPRLDSMELPGIASHLASMPSMSIDEQNIFERFRVMNPPTYTVFRYRKRLMLPKS
ncbi:hypothetical protein H5410_030759 [Solanum commersonii]|uniref:Uncharacterized protein n=1 Tax=Solanum commersonii TaxID=4109 RepID=A0A9J5YH51_SOLCO|nr:hypothetical protein H5410_030759 [Solanum commersonii]